MYIYPQIPYRHFQHNKKLKLLQQQCLKENNAKQILKVMLISWIYLCNNLIFVTHTIIVEVLKKVDIQK